MAYKLILFVSAIIATVNSAPASVFTQSILQTPEAFTRQYLLVSPQHQLANYKIQPQLVRPLSQFPRSELIYYYPTYNQPGPPHAPTLVNFSGFRDEAPWWQGFWNQFTGAPEMPAENPEMPAENPMPAEMTKMEKKEEKKPLMPSADGTFMIDGKRYILLPGQPQFFGNYDAFQNPISPFFSLQTLQPLITARSLEHGEVPAQPQPEAVDPSHVEIPAPPQADAPQTESRSLEGAADATIPMMMEETPMELKKEEEIIKEEMMEIKEEGKME